MAVRHISEHQDIMGPAADKTAALAGAAIGAYYFEDDTGIVYRKSVAGAWVAQTTSGITGKVAHDGAAGGAPLLIAGRAHGTQPGVVDNDNDVAYLWTTLRGALVQAPMGHLFLKLTADGQVKGGPGTLHTLTFSCNDAAPTAGSIIAFDSLTETGTEIFNHTFTTTPFAPFSVLLDVYFGTGLYIGFTTTNDVNVTASYR